MTPSLRGQSGRIKVGYQMVATLTSYALVPASAGVWTFEARASTVDPYWVTQRPQDVELVVGKQRWTWRNVALEIGGGTVRGTVTGKPERR
jgi:hypothetical protein